MPSFSQALDERHERDARRMQVDLLDTFVWYLHRSPRDRAERLALRSSLRALIAAALPWALAALHGGTAVVLATAFVIGALALALTALALRAFVQRGPVPFVLDSRRIVTGTGTFDVLAALYFLAAWPGSFVNGALLAGAPDPGWLAWLGAFAGQLVGVLTLGFADAVGLGSASFTAGAPGTTTFFFLLRGVLVVLVVTGVLEVRRLLRRGSFFVGTLQRALDEVRATPASSPRMMTRLQRVSGERDALRTDDGALERVLRDPRSLRSLHREQRMEAAAWEGGPPRALLRGGSDVRAVGDIDVRQDRHGVPVLCLEAPLGHEPAGFRFDAPRRTLAVVGAGTTDPLLEVEVAEFLAPHLAASLRLALAVVTGSTVVERIDVPRTGEGAVAEERPFPPGAFQWIVTDEEDVRLGLTHRTDLDPENVGHLEYDRTLGSLTAVLRSGRRLDLGLRVREPLDALLLRHDRVGLGREAAEGNIAGVILPLQRRGDPRLRWPVV